MGIFDWLQQTLSSLPFTVPIQKFPRLYQENVKTPKRIFKNKSLTYGVELEYVLAFHELEIYSRVQKFGPDHGIVKDIPLAIRHDPKWSPAVLAPFDRNANLIYNSWGIRKNKIKDKDPEKDWATIEPYGIEPQTIVANYLTVTAPLIGSKTRCKGEQTKQDKVDGAYTEWLFTTDRTVVGQGSANLWKWVPRISSAVSKQWDSYGIEVISPVLRSNDSRDRAELEQVVRVLKGPVDELYEGFITNQCALHVHVEAPSLAALKELACILLIYEEEISRLHPRCRRPGHHVARGNLISNRMQTFLGRNFVLTRDNVKPQFWDQRTDTSLFKQHRTIQQIRDEVDQLQNEKELADFMCFPSTGRLRIVSFRSLSIQGPPRTIEFRQARGTLDVEDVTHWVDFCVGLVQLAEHYVHNPDERIQNWDEDSDDDDNKLDVFQLMEAMKLDDRSIKYWQYRVARYMVGGDEDDRSDVENIPPEITQKKKKPPTLNSSPGRPSPPKPPPDGKPPLPSGGEKSKGTDAINQMAEYGMHVTNASPLPTLPLLAPKPIGTARSTSRVSSRVSPSKGNARLSKILEDFHAKRKSDKSFFDVDTAEGSNIPPASLLYPPNDLHDMDTASSSQIKSPPKPQPKPEVKYHDLGGKFSDGFMFGQQPGKHSRPEPEVKFPNIENFKSKAVDCYMFGQPLEKQSSSLSRGLSPPPKTPTKSSLFGRVSRLEQKPQPEPGVDVPSFVPLQPSNADSDTSSDKSESSKESKQKKSGQSWQTEESNKEPWEKNTEYDSDEEVQDGGAFAGGSPIVTKHERREDEPDDVLLMDFQALKSSKKTWWTGNLGALVDEPESEPSQSGEEDLVHDPEFIEEELFDLGEEHRNGSSANLKLNIPPVFTPKKRPAGELSADKKDAKKQKTTPKPSKPTPALSSGKKRLASEPLSDKKRAKKPKTSPPKTTEKYDLTEIIAILMRIKGNPKAWEEYMKDAVQTNPENQIILSKAVHEYFDHHKATLPSHVPGHSEGTTDEEIAQKMQNEWRDEDPKDVDDMAFALRIMHDEEERLTKEIGASCVAIELKVSHPPLTKFGLEELEEINSGTPNARLIIKNFSMEEWTTKETPVMVSGHMGACGAAAIVYSLRYQYPNEAWTRGLTPESFLGEWVWTVPLFGDQGRDGYYDEEQLNNALQRLTNGQIQLAVVHRGLENYSFAVPEAAVLTANGERARYLYIHLTHAAFRPTVKGPVGYQHFEALARKRGFKEHK